MPTEQQINETKKIGSAKFASLRSQGYTPDFSKLTQEQYINSLQRNPNDQKKFPEQPYGIQDPAWDYKNAVQGPDGQDLPNGAVGWTADGRPWYGTNNNFSEFWKGMTNKFNSETELSASHFFEQAKTSTFLKNIKDANSAGEVIGEAFSSIAAPFMGLGALADSDNKFETVLGKISKGLGLGIGLVGTGLGELAEGAEKTIAVASEVPESVIKAGGGEVKESAIQKAADELPDNFLGNSAQFLASFLREFNPIRHTWDAVRSAGTILSGKVSLKEFGDIISDEWQAGRILYTQWTDESVKAEYMRRLHRGENPYLLAEELQDPIAELAGELIFDPLNVLGFLHKGKNATKRLANFQEVMLKPDELVPFTKLNQLTDVEKTSSMIEGVGKFTDKIKSGVDDLAKQSGFRAATASAKRTSMERTIGQYSGWMINTVAKTEDGFDAHKASEAITALTKIYGKNGNDIIEGISTLEKLGVPSSAIYSEAAGRTGVYLLDMLEEAGGADKFLDAVRTAESTEDLLNYANPILDKATRKMFPSMAERAANPDKFGVMSVSDKAILQAEKALESPLLSGVNSALAHVYMGMSPGYVFRNVITNSMHIFMDIDAKTAAKALKGQVAVALGKNPVSLENATKLLEDVYGFVPEAAKAGIGQVGLAAKKSEGLWAKITGWGLEAGRNTEKAASTYIFEAATRDVLQKMWQPGRGIPDIAPLIDAGMDAEKARHLQNLLVQSNGNVDRAITAFRAQVATGQIDLFGSMGWLGNTERKLMSDFKILDRFTDGARSASEANDKEAVERLIQEILDDINTTADDVASDLRLAPSAGEGIDAPRQLEAVQDAQVYASNDEIKATITLQENANKAVDSANQDLINEYAAIMKQQGLDPQFQSFLKSNPELANTASEKLWQEADSEIKNLFQPAFDQMRLARDPKVKGYDIVKGWRNAGLSGTPPEFIKSRGEFASYLYNQYIVPSKRQLWSDFREVYADNTMQIVDHALSIGNFSSADSFASLDHAKDALEQARLWDNSAVIAGKATMLPEGANDFDKFMKLADINGIPTLTKSGTPSNRLLNTINKQLREEVGKAGKVDTIWDLPKVPKSADELKGVLKAPRKEFVDNSIDKLDDFSSLKITDANFIEGGGTSLDEVQASFTNYWQENSGYVFTTADGTPRVDPATLTGFEKASTPLEGVEVWKDDYNKWIDELNKTIHGIESTAVAKQFDNLQDIPYDEAVRVLQAKLGDDFVELGEDTARIIGDSVPPKNLGQPIPPDTGDMAMTSSRYYHNARKQGIVDELERIMREGVEKNWGTVQEVLPDGQEAELIKYATEASKRAAEMRLVAEAEGTALRNFALIDYSDRKNFDTVFSLAMPYGFWYSRTAPNWLKRVVERPGILAAYQRYKNTMAKIHSEQPEWWRYNVNSDELLGLFPENPLFFNLEQTLNPMNGLTGVDFDDPQKVTGWFTGALNDLGKFGPSTHTALSLATAIALNLQGKKEAAGRWGGTLFPQLTAGGSLQSILQSGVDLGKLTEGSDIDISFEGFAEKDEFGGTGIRGIQTLDPVAQFFSGGITPYEQQRVGRALASMIEEGIISEAQANDAARSQEGQIWDAALERSTNDRAVGQLAGFAFGVGFKGRSLTDQQVDVFYGDFFRLMEQRHNFSPSEFAQSMNALKDQYPFMDTLLIARKSGPERDTAFAYSVIGRLPPGSDILKNIGIDERLVQQFYDDKGQFDGNPVDGIEAWAQSDVDRFMASISDLSAVLAVPGDATQAEWDAARLENTQLSEIMVQQFGGVDANGQDIHDKIDLYFSLFDLDNGSDLAKSFMKSNPEVEAALTYRDQMIATYPDSLLGTYYGGIDRINRYFKSLMYSEAEKRFGEGILDIQAGYYNLFLTADRKAYLRQNPQLKQYWDFKDSVEDEINRRVVELGSKLGTPIDPEIRPDSDLNSTGAQDVLNAVQGDAVRTAQQWQQTLGQGLFESVARNIVFGEAMSNAVSTAVGRAAKELGMSKNDLVQLVGISLVEAGVTGQ
jgi:hypothetical protein